MYEYTVRSKAELSAIVPAVFQLNSPGTSTGAGKDMSTVCGRCVLFSSGEVLLARGRAGTGRHSTAVSRARRSTRCPAVRAFL